MKWSPSNQISKIVPEITSDLFLVLDSVFEAFFPKNYQINRFLYDINIRKNELFWFWKLLMQIQLVGVVEKTPCSLTMLLEKDFVENVAM